MHTYVSSFMLTRIEQKKETKLKEWKRRTDMSRMARYKWQARMKIHIFTDANDAENKPKNASSSINWSEYFGFHFCFFFFCSVSLSMEISFYIWQPLTYPLRNNINKIEWIIQSITNNNSLQNENFIDKVYFRDVPNQFN